MVISLKTCTADFLATEFSLMHAILGIGKEDIKLLISLT